MQPTDNTPQRGFPLASAEASGSGGEVWRRLNSHDAPMGRQLALSESLLANLAETPTPALRWYVTRKRALVLGIGQKPEVADLAACRRHHVRVYRRTSGGTAVLIDRDAVSMEVALPAGHPLATFDVVRGYRWIGEVWAQALRSLGIADARAIPTEEVRAIAPLAKDDPVRLACYGTLSPWETVVGQRKVVGLSQVRRRAGSLYQVGIYLCWRPQDLVALLALPDAERQILADCLRETTAGLDELAAHRITASEVIAAVEQSLTDVLGICLTPAVWTPAELATADRIERERFQPL